MPSERFTEELVLSELGIKLGKNGEITVFEQGNVEGIAKLDALLQKAGGKPDFCELADMKVTGTGNANPEFLVTVDHHPKTLIVIECKKSTRNHESGNDSVVRCVRRQNHWLQTESERTGLERQCFYRDSFINRCEEPIAVFLDGRANGKHVLR